MKQIGLFGVGLFAALALSAIQACAAPVLLISVDGMRPIDVLDAADRGATLPTLKKLMSDGAYASDVRNVTPTITIPNHTSLITGVTPARHGIPDNQPFDPMRTHPGHYYWYAQDIKVPTLWDLAHQHGAKVASLIWPVSVGASAIDFNIPEYWRDRDAEDLKVIRAMSTPGLADQLETDAGRLAVAVHEAPESDEALSVMAARLYALKKPYLFTLHFSSLDMAEHIYGPGSPQAIKALERIDADMARVVAAGRSAHPDLVVAIVSDHGFASVSHDINLVRAFADAGLVTLDATGGRPTAWQAMPWGGASAAVFLADPADQEVQARCRTLLEKLAADPRYGIAQVIDHAGVVQRGANPAASFYVDFRPGYEMGQRPDAPLDSPSALKGMHGNFPVHPEMHSSFFIAGPGIPRRGNIGAIDMLDIAPTLARVMGYDMPTASGKPLF